MFCLLIWCGFTVYGQVLGTLIKCSILRGRWHNKKILSRRMHDFESISQIDLSKYIYRSLTLSREIHQSSRLLIDQVLCRTILSWGVIGLWVFQTWNSRRLMRRTKPKWLGLRLTVTMEKGRYARFNKPSSCNKASIKRTVLLVLADGMPFCRRILLCRKGWPFPRC